MDRMLGLGVLAVAGLLLTAPAAQAFTMGETVTMTGVQGSLAQSGVSSPAKTLGGVRSALGAAVATKNAQLGGASWGDGSGGAKGWSTAGTGSGWSTAAGGGGWSTGGGWTMASSGANGWSSGSWQ